MEGWIFIVIFIVIIFIVIIAGILLWFFLREPEKDPPVYNGDDENGNGNGNEDENVENYTLDGINIKNIIFRNKALKIPGGPYLATEDNLSLNIEEANDTPFYGLKTSLTPSFEWTSERLRIKSNRYNNWCLSLSGEFSEEVGTLNSISLLPFKSEDFLQIAFNTGNLLLFFLGYSDGLNNTIQGLTAQIDGKSSLIPLDKNKAPIIRSTYKVILGSYEYTARNIVSFALRLTDNSDYLTLNSDNQFVYVKNRENVWNAVNRRIVNSFGGVLCRKSNGEVVIEDFEEDSLGQEAVAIGNAIYFIGENETGNSHFIDHVEDVISTGEISNQNIANSNVSKLIII